MPNWCSNVVRMRGPAEIVTKLKDDLNRQNQVFDFNVILPIPTALVDMKAPASSHYDEQKVAFNKAKYGAADWYDWCVNNWGTKWNASSPAIADDAEYEDMYEVMYNFDTAWSPPIPLYEELAKQYPDIQLYVCFDEPGVGFSGWRFYEGGELANEQEYDQSFWSIRTMLDPTDEIWDYVK